MAYTYRENCRRSTAGRGRSRFALGCATAFLLTASLAQARFTGERPSVAQAQFQRAEQMRLALDRRPEALRDRRDYDRVLNAYRAVYHGDPASSKADASISAVADLLTEEGRLFHSQKLLLDALGQYEFLRNQYPRSRYRFSALLAEGTIYHQDLADLDQAKSKFQEFLKTYPRNELAGQAHAELKQIHREEISQKQNRIGEERTGEHSEEMLPPPPGSGIAEASGEREASPASTGTSFQNAAALQSPAPTTAAPETTTANLESEEGEAQFSAPGTAHSEMALNAAPPSHRGRAPLVTGIRYWSTSQYTRIAIDVEEQVPYETARVPNPDRVYFDLRGTHLIHGLMGESMSVTDDGFLKRIRAAQFSRDVTRIVLDVNTEADYTAFFLPNPWRLIIDIRTRKSGALPLTEAESHSLSPPGSGAGLPRQPESRPDKVLPPTVVVMDGPALAPRFPNSRSEESELSQPPLPAEAGDQKKPSPVRRSTALPAPPVSAPPPLSPETETSAGNGTDFPAARDTERANERERSLARTLGLKIGRIVIDPGHGGHDCGTLGPGGIEEKDIVLDVGLRLGKLLKQRLGADVIFTRDDDTFIPLEQRTAIANKARADLFISIHANSSSDPMARGVESYYLNFTTSPDALEVAARENAVSDQSIYELSDLVKQITLKDKIEESREFAVDVQRSLYSGLQAGNPGLKDRGVKKAPFVVLIGANMPSILAEISFLTNPNDAHELRQAAYRQRIAESLYHGVARYINGLNGIRLAENTEHADGN